MLFLFKNNSFAGNNVVELNPEVGQGYIVLSKFDFPNVDHWQIKISRRTMNQDSTFNDSSIAEVNLPSGRNYWKVPDDYKVNTSSAHYRYTVSGYSNSDELLVTQDKGDLYNKYVPALCNCPQPIYHPTCSWKCNGTTYAWEIQQYTDSVGMSHLQLETGYNYFDSISNVAIPYYIFMNGISKVNSYCNAHQLSYSPYNLRFVGPLNADSATFCTPTGTILSGDTIYGVAKDLGPWQGNIIETSDISFSPPVDCNKTNRPTSWAITEFNNNANSPLLDTLPLVCDPSPCNTSFGGSSGGNKPPCLLSLITSVDNDTSATPNFTKYYQDYRKCLNKHLGKGDAPWPTYVSMMKFTNLNTDTGTPIVINMADSIAANKDEIYVHLTPGLWCIGTVFNDGKYLPIIKEALTNKTIKIDLQGDVVLASLLEASVQPVPIVGNQFEITVKSDTTMNVHYQLVDFNGNILYEKDFIAEKGVSQTYTINPGQEIPSGILFNRFTLDDGSVKTVEAIKN